MRSFHALVIVALLAAPTAAFAQETQAADPAAAPVAAPTSDLDKIVCRAGEPITGTRFPGPRICKTQREWDDIRMRAQHDLARDQSRGCKALTCS
ncbi:MAG TPA: hypothetical protein VG889_17995 [Rhizomicrobium sp.]|nr:hypothetical protein [Rhizomicrobium sp.]